MNATIEQPELLAEASYSKKLEAQGLLAATICYAPSKGRKKWLAQYEWQKGLCAICGQHFPPAMMTRDHIVPRSRGGGTDWDNIHLTCEPCNTAKGDTLPIVGFRHCEVCNERVTFQKHSTCKNEECPRTYMAMIAVPGQGHND